MSRACGWARSSARSARSESLRALLRAHPQARDIEIVGAGLEEAFLEITGRDDPEDEDQEVRAA